MMNLEQEKSPRPAATGRDDKAVQNQLHCNIFGRESQALIQILGQEHICEMLYRKKLEDEIAGFAEQTEEVRKAANDFAQAMYGLCKITDCKLLNEIDEYDAAYGAANEKQGFYYGARYMLNFIFGGELFEN